MEVDGTLLFCMELSIELNRSFFCYWPRFMRSHFSIHWSLLIFCHIFVITSGLVAASCVTSCMIEWETNTEIFTLKKFSPPKWKIKSTYFGNTPTKTNEPNSKLQMKIEMKVHLCKLLNERNSGSRSERSFLPWNGGVFFLLLCFLVA